MTYYIEIQTKYLICCFMIKCCMLIFRTQIKMMVSVGLLSGSWLNNKFDKFC